MLPTVEWVCGENGSLMPGKIRMIDQTLLPGELRFIETCYIEQVWQAIKTLQVRGAPAIGVAAAMGVAANVQNCHSGTTDELLHAALKAADYLASSRPTAVNLFWALDRMKHTAKQNIALAPEEFKKRLIEEALAICREDTDMCKAIGRHGAGLLFDGCSVLTHCNAGSLAASLYGTALAPIYVAAESGLKVSVFSDETRPLLQGSRLTAWELMRAGIDVTVICDNTAAQVMREGRVDMVMVGADRIAANGDVANKIGTYGVAVLASYHKIPFYVLAPTSTFDMNLEHGGLIPIEQRASEEVVCGFGARTAPENAKVYSPAFDVTPNTMVAGIICEKGMALPPFNESLLRMTS